MGEWRLRKGVGEKERTGWKEVFWKRDNLEIWIPYEDRTLTG